jgi:hypothetical protein
MAGMVDRDDLVELVPHYLAMLLLAIATLALVQALAPDLNFWIETALVVAVLVIYRPIVIRLGVAPRVWQRDDRTP